MIGDAPRASLWLLICTEITACAPGTARDALGQCISQYCLQATDLNACVNTNCSAQATQPAIDAYNAEGACLCTFSGQPASPCGTACSAVCQ